MRSLSVQQFSVEVEHIPIKSDGPVELSFANEVVTVQHVHSDQRGQSHLTLTGTASFTGDRPLNLQRRRLAQPETGANLSIPISPPTAFANVNLTIDGTASESAYVGTSGSSSCRCLDDRSAGWTGRCQWDAGVQSDRLEVRERDRPHGRRPCKARRLRHLWTHRRL